mgnify:CR=1 FL=1
MPGYGVSADAFATATTYKTAILILCDVAGDHVEVIELGMYGSGSAAAADRQHRASFTFSSHATDGTTTAVTPEPLEQYAIAALPTVGIEASAEPTTYDAASLAPVSFSFNQRGGMRWARPRGEGVHVRNGDTTPDAGWKVLSDAAGEIDANLIFWTA